MAPRARPDFVKITLSRAGEAFAGKGGVVRIANSRLHYEVRAGEATEVLTSQWAHMLSREVVDGKPIFAIVADPSNEMPAEDAEETSE